MEEYKINTGKSESRILLGESIANLNKYIPKDKKAIIITDKNILNHYSEYFKGFEIIELGTGESNKTLQTIDFIMGRLVDAEADRSSFIIGIGGGIVCDTAGFAASIYMRGLRLGFVSTTLLSMVDASVGGKNGVNFKGFKNMIGVFNQPEFVICDYDMLHTLDRREYIGGFAEIIKHGAIKDKTLFNFIEQNCENALNYHQETIHRLVSGSAKIKAAVVEADEKEKGERRKLYFGHTFAHSIEKHTGMPHGEAFAIGMVMAAKVSVNLGLLSELDFLRLQKIIQDYGLPVKLNISPNQLFEGMKKDKKREGESIHLVLLQGIGEALVQNVPLKKLEEIINDLR